MKRASPQHRPAPGRARRARPPSWQQGFTLTELFTVLAIAAVLSAVAIPNLQEYMLNGSRTTRLNSLVAAVNLARNEAISNRTTVTLCRVAMPATTCAAGGNWATGWAIRWDRGDGTDPPPDPPVPDGDIDDPEDLVRVFDPGVPANGSFTASTDAAGLVAVSQVLYAPTGRIANPTNDIVRFTLCDQRGVTDARAVWLSFGGQPRIPRDANDDGVHEVDGDDLQC